MPFERVIIPTSLRTAPPDTDTEPMAVRGGQAATHAPLQVDLELVSEVNMYNDRPEPSVRKVPRAPFLVVSVDDDVADPDDPPAPGGGPLADGLTGDGLAGAAPACELEQAVARRATAAIGRANRPNSFPDEKMCIMISSCIGSPSDYFRYFRGNAFRGSIRRSARNGSALPMCDESRRATAFALNRAWPLDVSRGMRDFAIDISRGLAAAGVLLSAVVHLDLWEQGFGTIPAIGPSFLFTVIAGLVIGVAALVWRNWLPALVAAGFGAGTVAAFWISVVYGLFGFKEAAPTAAPEVLAEVAEFAAVVFGLAAAALLWQGRRVHRKSATLASSPTSERR